MFQDGVEIDYPIGGSHNCGILTFDLDVDVFGSPGDYATVTVVKPDGQPLVMVDYLLPGGLDPIFGRNDLAVFNVESGTYILKVTSIGRADIEYPFTIEPDENLDMGSIVLTRLPAED